MTGDSRQSIAVVAASTDGRRAPGTMDAIVAANAEMVSGWARRAVCVVRRAASVARLW